MSNTSVSSSVTATFSQVQGSSSHGSTTVRKRTGTTPVLDEGNSSWSPSSVYEEAHEGRETTLTDRGRTIATTTVSDDEDEDDSEGPTIRFVERTKIAQAQSISWATTTSTTHSSTFPMPLPTELDTASLHHSDSIATIDLPYLGPSISYHRPISPLVLPLPLPTAPPLAPTRSSSSSNGSSRTLMPSRLLRALSGRSGGQSDVTEGERERDGAKSGLGRSWFESASASMRRGGSSRSIFSSADDNNLSEKPLPSLPPSTTSSPEFWWRRSSLVLTRDTTTIDHWPTHRILLLLCVVVLFSYSSFILVLSIATYLRSWPQADVILSVHPSILLSTLLTSLFLFLTSLLGLLSVTLPQRHFLLFIFFIFLWPGGIGLISVGFAAWKRRSFALDLRLDLVWREGLNDWERWLVQDALKCCGYTSFLDSATISSTCTPRSLLPGCKTPLYTFSYVFLRRVARTAIGVMVLHAVLVGLVWVCRCKIEVMTTEPPQTTSTTPSKPLPPAPLASTRDVPSVEGLAGLGLVHELRYDGTSSSSRADGRRRDVVHV